MKMYHYFVSYAIDTDSLCGSTFGMDEVLRAEKITCIDDIISFRKDISEKLDISEDDICLLSMPQLIQDEPY